MKTDVVIVGGGPGGAACSMFLARHGIRSVIVEKDGFPRYHIGESMTGECGALVKELGLEEKMARSAHPVKRGVTVYGPNAGDNRLPRAEREARSLAGAEGTRSNRFLVEVKGRTPDGRLEEGFTWQVRRSEFDAMMLDEALSRGAELVRGLATRPIRNAGGGVRGVSVTRADGSTEDVNAEVVVDASGNAAFLCRTGVTSPRREGRYDRQVAVFSQVKGALRDEGKHRNSTIIFYKEKLHWAWFIPLDEDVVSVGVVIPVADFQARGESKHDFLVRELGDLNPELARRIVEPELVEEARTIPNYSYEVDDYTGDGFVCIGDAHRFIDPIFSFGLFITMNEAKLAAGAIAKQLGAERRAPGDPFAEHRRRCNMGLENVQSLIDGFWAEPLGFSYLVHRRHPDEMVDLLAGRVYETAPTPALDQLRMLARKAAPM